MATSSDKIIEAMNTLAQSSPKIKEIAASFDAFDMQNLIDAFDEATSTQEKFRDAVEQSIEATEALKKEQMRSSEQEAERQKTNSKYFHQTAKQIRINKELEKHFGALGKTVASLKTPLDKFGNALGNLPKILKNNLKGISDGFKDVFKKGIGKFGAKFPKIATFAKKTAFLGKLGKLGSFAALGKFKLAMLAIAQSPAFKVFTTVLKGTFKVFAQGIKIGTKFAKVMVGLPLQILGSVAKIGHSFRKDIVEVVGTAIESVKDFMDVSSGMGASIKALSDSEATSLDKFLNVRGDFVKLFGYGAGGKAQFIAELSTAVQNLGQLADTVSGTITRSVDNAMYFIKATRSMGMASADIEYIAAEAVKNGESIYSALDRVVLAADATSKQFGVDRKKLSKNFFVLRKDIVNFGHLSDRQIMQTSAKLTQMGLSMKEAAAVFGKIDTFESAAQTSAMLSQTFGMNLDALKLLRAEKPEEIIEQFRDAMLSTGRSFDDLNRHEKSLMASHTGLSAEALKMTMNYRNLGMSFSDIQKKMKEDDPTQQQIKNLELMSGSLKTIQKTLTGDNIFKNFTDGVLETMKAASGLSPILLRVSERFEDFFISGLKISDKSKEAIAKAFTPFTDVLEKLVGDGSSKKGILDADNFKSVFEDFSTQAGNYLGRAFKGENLKSLQGEIRNSFKDAFDFKNINQGNTIVGKLFTTSGEIIGQMLKAFAAFGPGIIDTVMDAFDGIVDFLFNYKSQATGDNSIVGMMQSLFKLSDNDTDAILDTFSHLIDRVLSSKGPLMRLYYWMNSKFLGLIKDTFDGISQVAADSLFGYDSALYQYGKSLLYSVPIIGFLFDTSNDTILKQTQKKFKGISLQSLNLEEIISDERYDESQVQGLGKISAALQTELVRQKYDPQKQKEIQAILKRIEDAKGTFFDKLDQDDFVKSIAKEVASYRGLTLSIDKSKDSISSANKSKLLGEGGMALVRNSSTGLNVTQYAAGDQVVAGKEGGPIVSAIAYAGHAVNSLLEGAKRTASQLNGSSTLASGVGSSDLKIYLQVDGNTLTEVVLDNDLIRKATQKKNGRVTLADGTAIDASGSSIQSTSLA